MDIILNLTLPFFAVIGLGFLAVRLGMADASAIGALNIFVFNFAMPALVAGALARQPIDVLINPAFLVGWALAGLLVFALGMAVSRIFFSGSLREMALTGQAASVGNVGFLGFPLLAASFGDDGLRLAASAIFVDLLVLIPLSFCLLEASGGGSARQMAGRIARGVFFNPFMIAILIGFSLSASGIGLSGPMDRFASFLGSAAGPTALFALGISLAGRRIEGDLRAAGAMSAMKLLVHPAAVFATLYVLDVPVFALAAGTVIAALPIAGNVFVISAQYGVMPRRSSTAILLSTLFAIVTTAAALYLAGVDPG
ncbi:MAG: AEC family transporter [Pseudomonadota bacterium]